MIEDLEGLKRDVAEVKFLIHDLRVESFINEVIHYHVTVNTDLEVYNASQAQAIHAEDVQELKTRALSQRKKQIALQKLAQTHPELVPLAESFRSCLPPKPGGVLTLLDAAPGTDVLLIAHRGLEGLAEVTDLLSGSAVGKKIEVRVWRIDAADIPEGEARRRWLFDCWKRVDDFVYAAG